MLSVQSVEREEIGLKTPTGIVVFRIATGRDVEILAAPPPGRDPFSSDEITEETVFPLGLAWPHSDVGLSGVINDLINAGFATLGIDAFIEAVGEAGELPARIVELKMSSSVSAPRKLPLLPMFSMLTEGVFDDLVITSAIKEGVRVDTIEATERPRPSHPGRLLRFDPNDPVLYRLEAVTNS